MRTLWRVGLVMVGAAALYLGWIAAGRVLGRSTARLPAAVRILHFFAGPSEVVEGQKTTVCYGVENARSVSIEPRIEAIAPSPNRCIEVTLHRDTRYTLTAEGADGRRVSESFMVEVKPDPATAPRILFFEDRGARPGESAHSLCFDTANATQVNVRPPVIQPAEDVKGCFSVTPKRTTTYTLTASDDKGRQDFKRVTVLAP